MRAANWIKHASLGSRSWTRESSGTWFAEYRAFFDYQPLENPGEGYDETI
jgi:hypothetical protein